MGRILAIEERLYFGIDLEYSPDVMDVINFAITLPIPAWSGCF